MKYKKIITTMIILLLAAILSTKNVKAIEIQTDIAKHNPSDSNSYLVTNAENIVLENFKDIAAAKAYKILDTYYNQTSNEISYNFTTAFEDFLKSENNDLTIDDYFSLTSDEHKSVITTSTLNKLLSRYATYIKENSISSNYNMAEETIVETGCYLILVTPQKLISEENIVSNYVYGISTANLVFEVTEGEWNLKPTSVYLKNGGYKNATFISQPENFMFKEINAENIALQLWKITTDQETSLSISKNTKFFYGTIKTEREVPTNNTAPGYIVRASAYDFDKHINYDLNNIYVYSSKYGIVEKLQCSEGICIIGDGKKVKVEKFFEYNELETENTKKLSFIEFDESNFIKGGEWGIIFANLYISDDNFSANKSYDINYTEAYLTDPYAPDLNEAVEIVTLTSTIYTYNLKLSNVNSKSEGLAGAEFGIYLDPECTVQIGENITIGSDGYAMFNGIAGGEYYLKQEKAASGYRIIETNPMLFALKTDNLVDDEYFELTVTSPASLLLPFTGGKGTIIYTIFGFVIIIGSSIGIYIYIKKKKEKK